MYHVTPLRNLKSIMRDGLIPKIGPRSKQLAERYPMVYLFTSMEAVEDALMGWFGREFKGKLAILEIQFPNSIFPSIVWDSAWCEIESTIPAENIQLIRVEE